MAWLLVAITAAIGLTQLVPAVRFALTDRSSDVLRQWRVSRYVQSGVNPYPVALAALQAAAKAGKFDDPSNSAYIELSPRRSGHKAPPHAGEMPKYGPIPIPERMWALRKRPIRPRPPYFWPSRSGNLPPGRLSGFGAVLNLALMILIAYELAICNNWNRQEPGSYVVLSRSP